MHKKVFCMLLRVSDPPPCHRTQARSSQPWASHRSVIHAGNAYYLLLHTCLLSELALIYLYIYIVILDTSNVILCILQSIASYAFGAPELSIFLIAFLSAVLIDWLLGRYWLWRRGRLRDIANYGCTELGLGFIGMLWYGQHSQGFFKKLHASLN